MYISVLASGSTGNSTFIKCKSGNILVDVGTNMTYISNKLNEINEDIKDIKYIFISHTHTDHTSSLKQIIKKYHPVVLLSELMLKDLDYLQTYDNLMYYDQDLMIKDLKVEFIKTSHDVTDSRGFIFTEENRSVVYITDTGYINSKFFKQLSNKNIYIMESNHDIEKLINGPYPKWLQNRVLSDVGHLSNSASSYYLTKLVGPDTHKIILAHLSKENNTENLALETIHNMFKEYNIEMNDIITAKPDLQTGLIEV